jgi:hypothetical protein
MVPSDVLCKVVVGASLLLLMRLVHLVQQKPQAIDGSFLPPQRQTGD